VSGLVFPTFPREVYECDTYAAAVALCRAHGWPGISPPSYGLRRPLLEVNSMPLKRSGVVHEVHPELSFWKMNKEMPLSWSKHSWNGFFERRSLLAEEGIVFPERLPIGVGLADVLDAAAAAWTARRIATREHEAFPVDSGAESTITF
jgi:predicted RNase H-like nuclease